MNPAAPEEPVITYPCFILRSSNDRGFLYHDTHDGSITVPVLTDTDTLDRYRRKHGLESRGALQFNNPAELLANLDQMPPVVSHLAFDPPEDTSRGVVTWNIRFVKHILARDAGLL